MPGCRVDAIASSGPDHLYVDVRGTRPGGRCPNRGRASRAAHSRYRRHPSDLPSDLPSLGRRIKVALWVRRFCCRNPGCTRRTLAKRLPELVVPHARRTRRLASAQGRIGVALGGEAGARLLQHLAMPTSAGTVLRLVRHMPLPEGAARIIAADDWAIRKGRTDGTVVVGLERRRVADLLADRTGAAVARWLRQRPGVEVVARDRSTGHARAVSIGAPGAVQMADRWAPAGQHAPGAGTLAAHRPCPAPAPAVDPGPVLPGAVHDRQHVVLGAVHQGSKPGHPGTELIGGAAPQLAGGVRVGSGERGGDPGRREGAAHEQKSELRAVGTRLDPGAARPRLQAWGGSGRSLSKVPMTLLGRWKGRRRESPVLLASAGHPLRPLA